MTTYPLSILAYWERRSGVWARQWEGDCEDFTLSAAIAMCQRSAEATAGELREAASGAVLWRWEGERSLADELLLLGERAGTLPHSPALQLLLHDAATAAAKGDEANARAAMGAAVATLDRLSIPASPPERLLAEIDRAQVRRWLCRRPGGAAWQEIAAPEQRPSRQHRVIARMSDGEWVGVRWR